MRAFSGFRIIAVSINVLASRHSQRTNQVNPFSIPFLEDTLGWVALSSCGYCSPVYRLVYSGSPLISCHFFILSKAIPRFWSTLQDCSGCRARRSGYPASQGDLEQLGMWLVSISWTLTSDGWKRTPSMFVQSSQPHRRFVKIFRVNCSKTVAFKTSPLRLYCKTPSNPPAQEKYRRAGAVKVMNMIITINDDWYG